jgi:hypothetical protein
MAPPSLLRRRRDPDSNLTDIFFQLYGIAPLGIDYEHRQVDYTTEKGYRVWINRADD